MNLNLKAYLISPELDYLSLSIEVNNTPVLYSVRVDLVMFWEFLLSEIKLGEFKPDSYFGILNICMGYDLLKWEHTYSFPVKMNFVSVFMDRNRGIIESLIQKEEVHK